MSVRWWSLWSTKTDASLPTALESITLTPLVQGTKIERVTEMGDREQTISWWAKLFKRLFGSFSQTKPDQTLKRLAQLVEQKRYS
jgi:hypothetical protein